MMSQLRSKAAILEVDVQLACPVAGVPDENSFLLWADAAYQEIMTDDTSMAIRVVAPTEMKGLNRDYRGQDKPTNVLAFNIDSPHGSGVAILGDIVICRDVVLDEAAKQNKSLEGHWAHMTVHGVLHLCGFDHVLPEEAAEMESLEAQILVKLGFPNPW
jgi:probable rRNA maturation factor